MCFHASNRGEATGALLLQQPCCYDIHCFEPQAPLLPGWPHVSLGAAHLAFTAVRCRSFSIQPIAPCPGRAAKIAQDETHLSAQEAHKLEHNHKQEHKHKQEEAHRQEHKHEAHKEKWQKMASVPLGIDSKLEAESLQFLRIYYKHIGA